MSRWHDAGCLSPQVQVKDGLPECLACGRSPDLASLMPMKASPIPSIPPDEPAGSMNLWWPRTVPYYEDGENRPTNSHLEGHVTPAHAVRDLDVIETTTVAASATYSRSLKSTEMRLVVLSTAERQDIPVHLELEVYKLDECPEYEAVSYLWGGENGDNRLCCPLYVGPFWDVLFQTRNCHDMLQFMRPWRGIRLVWVDAVCINQDNVSERCEQVANMALIYSGSTRVVAYLGSDLAMPLTGRHPRRHSLCDLADESVVPEFPWHPHSSVQVTIESLLEKRYFSRVWIVQELLLPRAVLMRVGDIDFWADALTWTRISDLGLRWEDTAAPWVKHLSQGVLPEKNIQTLLSLTSRTEATDPRDRIFGLSGILPSREEGPNRGLGTEELDINYSLSCQHVFVGIFSHCLLNLGQGQILLQACGTKASSGYPSWAPEWKSQEIWSRTFGHPPELSAESSLSRDLYEHKSLLPASYDFRTCEISSAASAIYDRTIGANVCSRTGALQIYLTHFMSIKSQPRWISKKKEYHIFLIRNAAMFPVYAFSECRLDKLKFLGNEQVYILPTSGKNMAIYPILRPINGVKDSFRLIATCRRLVIIEPCTRDAEDNGQLAEEGAKLGSNNFTITQLQLSFNRNLWKALGPGREPLDFDGFPKAEWLIRSFLPSAQTVFPLVHLCACLLEMKVSGRNIHSLAFEEAYLLHARYAGENDVRIEADSVIFSFKRKVWRDQELWQRYIPLDKVDKGWEFRTKDSTWAPISCSNEENEDGYEISDDDWIEVQSPISNLVDNLANASQQLKEIWDGFEALRRLSLTSWRPIWILFSKVRSARSSLGHDSWCDEPTIIDEPTFRNSLGITGITRRVRIVQIIQSVFP